MKCPNCDSSDVSEPEDGYSVCYACMMEFEVEAEGCVSVPFPKYMKTATGDMPAKGSSK